MRPFPLYGDESKPDSAINKIIQGALGVPIELDSAPAVSDALTLLPKANDFGFFGNDLYINLQGSVIKFTGTLIV